MIQLSVIIQEHNEGRERVQRMVNQTAQLPIPAELIYVTSMKTVNEFNNKYGPFRMPVSVIPNIQSCGAARNYGGRMAKGDTLLYVDSHVCFSPDMVNRLFMTLEAHRNAIVAPAIQAIEFPACTIAGGTGHGVYFRFSEGHPFEWVWESAPRTDMEFEVPFVCGCAFSMKRDLFNILDSYGGFLGNHEGLSWEEEKSMRLWRLGYPTYIEPRAVFGHYYKGYKGHTSWDQHSTAGYYRSRVGGFYVNVLNKELYDYIERLLAKSWGDEYWKHLELARKEYGWLRMKLMPRKSAIDENWFLRRQ